MTPIGPLSALVVPRCICCRGAAPRRDLICARCRSELPWLPSFCCPRCALPLPCAQAGKPCPASRWAFERAWAPLAYEGPVPAIVRALKERGSIGTADYMAAMVVAGAPAQLLRDRVRIVPVPGDPWRTRKRGLDHSLLLANAIGRRAGLDVSAPLVRQRSARQAGKGRRERLAGPAIGVRKGAVVEGSYVLIDDVHTTGATLHAAAVALRRAGACHVDAATFGRTR